MAIAIVSHIRDTAPAKIARDAIEGTAYTAGGLEARLFEMDKVA
jgi:hypothetical protein